MDQEPPLLPSLSEAFHPIEPDIEFALSTIKGLVFQMHLAISLRGSWITIRAKSILEVMVS